MVLLLWKLCFKFYLKSSIPYMWMWLFSYFYFATISCLLQQNDKDFWSGSFCKGSRLKLANMFQWLKLIFDQNDDQNFSKASFSFFFRYFLQPIFRDLLKNIWSRTENDNVSDYFLPYVLEVIVKRFCFCASNSRPMVWEKSALKTSNNLQ